MKQLAKSDQSYVAVEQLIKSHQPYVCKPAPWPRPALGNESYGVAAQASHPAHKPHALPASSGENRGALANELCETAPHGTAPHGTALHGRSGCACVRAGQGLQIVQ